MVLLVFCFLIINSCLFVVYRLDLFSIRRLRNWEGDRELRKRGIDLRVWKKERKEVRLLF